jgi:arylformamidase
MTTPTSTPTPRVDFRAAVSLALPLDFDGPQPQHFGAPRATSTAFHSGDFEGDVARGSSCNCSSVTLIPHCNGTHTESVSHLTLQQRPLHTFVPVAPMPALLLTVEPQDAATSGEDSEPAPQAGDQMITRAGLLAAWQRCGNDARHPAAVATPCVLLLRTRAATAGPNPAYLSRQLMQEIVARGIRHLVVDLPSVDRSEDEGHLTAHRLFFGLPAGSIDHAQATRADCTITELAHFPRQLADGPCALQLQLPAFSGDAVPSRPVYLPLAAS